MACTLNGKNHRCRVCKKEYVRDSELTKHLKARHTKLELLYWGYNLQVDL